MILYLNSYPCLLIKNIHKEASKPTIKSPQDLGFFNPTLQHDFPELRSYSDVCEFINHIQECKNQYRDVDILQMLPKYLRGPANQWCRDLLESSDLRGLSRILKMWLLALKIQFKKTEQTAEPPQQIASQTTSNPAHYHKCIAYLVSFSSLSRLLTHSQSDRCSKAFCNHCDVTFDSKNKLHKHIRNKDCLTIPSAIKSKTVKKFALTPLRGWENNINSNGDHCYLKGEVDQIEIEELKPLSSESTTATPTCSVNPISASETSVISLATLPTTPPPTYRAISPGPPAYQSIKPRDYLTLNNLFMRYASLKRIQLDQPSRLTLKILSIIIIQDLYHRFGKQEKQTKKQAQHQASIPCFSKPGKRHSGTVILTSYSSVIKYLDSTVKSNIKTSYLITSKSNTPPSILQHITLNTQAPLGHIIDNNLRGYTLLSLGLIVAINRSAAFISSRREYLQRID